MAVKMTALTSQGFSEGTQIECPGVVVGGWHVGGQLQAGKDSDISRSVVLNIRTSDSEVASSNPSCY